jgi:hypothetical protein
MNPNNHVYDTRFFIGLITVIAGTGYLSLNLIVTISTKLGTIAGAVDLFCGLVGLWSIGNIAGNYFFKFPIRTRLATNEVQFAIVVAASVVIYVISLFGK